MFCNNVQSAGRTCSKSARVSWKASQDHRGLIGTEGTGENGNHPKTFFARNMSLYQDVIDVFYLLLRTVAGSTVLLAVSDFKSTLQPTTKYKRLQLSWWSFLEFSYFFSFHEGVNNVEVNAFVYYISTASVVIVYNFIIPHFVLNAALQRTCGLFWSSFQLGSR